MPLYTVVLDYGGGTYICQHEAGDQHEALVRWADRLATERIVDEISNEVATALDPALNELVALDGLTNAWCTSTCAKQGLALVNIIQTAV